MKNIILLLFMIVFLCSCSYKTHKIENKDKFTTTFNYGNVSKDSILNAAKKSFYFTNKHFVIDSYRNSLVVRKSIFHAISAHLTKDIYYFNVEEKNNNSVLKLYIKRYKNDSNENFIFLSKDEHKNFFKRLDYFLSFKKSWPRCETKDLFYNSFCDSYGYHILKSPKEHDIDKNILMSQRRSSKNIIEISSDILLKDDILISKNKDDVLEKEDNIEINSSEDIKDIIDNIKIQTDKSLTSKL